MNAVEDIVRMMKCVVSRRLQLHEFTIYKLYEDLYASERDRTSGPKPRNE